MSKNVSSKLLAGAAAMVALSAVVAAAQTTTSTKRIPISKEAPGEVSIAKTDTVTVYRTDTLRMSRVDTVMRNVPGATNTVYRTDTVMVQPMMKGYRLPSGFYVGIGGGVSAPNGSLFTPNSAGPTAQAQLGWQSRSGVFGLRADANYAKPGEDSQFSSYQADPDIFNASIDAKLQLPFLAHNFGNTMRFGIYGIGGYTHTSFKDLPMRVDGFNANGVPLFTVGNTNWQNFNGWNAGGGASLAWGRTELFLETRVLAFKPDNAPQARQMPFVLGLNLF